MQKSRRLLQYTQSLKIIILYKFHHRGSCWGPRSKQISNSSSLMCLIQRYIFILDPITFFAESNKSMLLLLRQWTWKLLCRSYIIISVGWGDKAIWNLARKILPLWIFSRGFPCFDTSIPAVLDKFSRRFMSRRNGGVPGGSFTEIVRQVPPFRERQAVLWFFQSSF